MKNDNYWKDLKAVLKEQHKERVKKTPERIEYACALLDAAGIEYQLKNPATGHFHCWRKADGKLFQFYAGTGKIQGYDKIRGIHALVNLLSKGVSA